MPYPWNALCSVGSFPLIRMITSTKYGATCKWGSPIWFSTTPIQISPALLRPIKITYFRVYVSGLSRHDVIKLRDILTSTLTCGGRVEILFNKRSLGDLINMIFDNPANCFG